MPDTIQTIIAGIIFVLAFGYAGTKIEEIMTAHTDRNKTQSDPQDSAIDLLREKLAILKHDQQYLGRLDVYNQMEWLGVDEKIIQKIKEKFND